MKLARRFPRLFWCAAGLIALLLLGLGVPRSLAYFVPGDPKKGMKLFFEKGCASCHSVLGEGGRRAPDLARFPAGHLNVAQLVAAMWNHAPEMWEKMELEDHAPPRFTSEEMTDLFSFLYSVRSFDEPGSAERGRRVMSEKRCATCHALEGPGGRPGPNLSAWAAYRNPVVWAQAMWNHAPQMQQAIASRGFAWPVFAGTDMADLIAYVQSQTPAGPAVHMILPDAARGHSLFDAKGCVRCHGPASPAINVSDRFPRGPRLTARGFPQTLGQFAGLMWNHSPQMWQRMRAEGIPRPQFTRGEMADLIAYLFSERFLDARGNSLRGQQVFSVKGCSNCHSAAGGRAPLGPDASAWKDKLAAVDLATAMWNHGPVMLETMRKAKISWPRFQEDEVSDLLEFLRSGQLAGADRRLPRPKPRDVRPPEAKKR